MPSASRRALAILFFTVFVDLVGFGILIPILPTFTRSLGASATLIGALGATYSLAQMLFAPLWGRLSDRVGRRPIIIGTALAAGASYVVFGLAESLWLLFVARAFAGICGANIGAAQAYVADITGPEDRARGMGLVGAALGLGFTVGPAIGGLAADWGGERAPFFVAAGLGFANALWAFLALPEPAQRKPSTARGLGTLADALRLPTLAFWVAAMLLVTVAFSQIETAYVLFNTDRLGFTSADNGLMFTFIGVVLVLVQGGAVRPLTRRFGSVRLIGAGAAICAAGALVTPLVRGVPLLVGATFLVALGNALYSPSLSATISLAAPVDRQGEMLGVGQSAGALGRVVGPLVAGALYDVGAGLPFLLAGGLLLVAAAASFGRQRQTKIA